MAAEVPNRWESTAGEDEWRVEIEADCFADDEPFVVSVWIEGEEGVDGPSERSFQALATPTPEQAREMAAALVLYADLADDANQKTGEARNG